MTNLQSVPLDKIIVKNRIRIDLGNLDTLRESISELGLLEPIAVTQCDDMYQLLFGERRLESAKQLGWTHINSLICDMSDAEDALKREVHENEIRREFSDVERARYAESFADIARKRAKERQSILNNVETADSLMPNWAQAGRSKLEGTSREEIAKRAGFGGHSQYDRITEVINKRPDLAEKVHSGEMTTFTAFSKMREDEGRPLNWGKKKAHTEKAELRMRDSPPTNVQPDRITKTEAINHIVKQVPVEMPNTFDAFNPTTITLTGRGFSAMPHDKLVENPVYLALFEHDTALMRAYHKLYAEMRERCENYEKRIRAYEENVNAQHRYIEKLEAQNGHPV